MLPHVVETAWGWFGLATRDGRVCRTVLPGSDLEQVLSRLGGGVPLAQPAPPPLGLVPLLDAVVQYFRGELVDPAAVALELDLGVVTPFQRRIYDELRRIPRGAVITYGQLAERAGAPGAARAVGGAMARNQLPLLVPCHRVVGSGRMPGGFSAPGGLGTKLELLALEGIAMPARPASAPSPDARAASGRTS